MVVITAYVLHNWSTWGLSGAISGYDCSLIWFCERMEKRRNWGRQRRWRLQPLKNRWAAKMVS